MPPNQQLIFRAHEGSAANLRVLAESNERTVSDELRAALDVWIDLINLAHLRATHPSPGSEALIAQTERQVRENIGRVLLNAIPEPARARFEGAAGIGYPVSRRGPIYVPFDKLLPWIATGRVE